MPFYMFQASYTSDAINAMMKHPQDREAAAGAMVESVGGTLHSFFFSMGSDDVVAIIEAPDDAAMAAGSLIVGASGSMHSGRTTKLMTSAEGMAAMKAAADVAKGYKPATG